ncbi:hypothetical protein EVAR_41582_1 [Eumeta japonica]|uniref:Uncharacterized protein n=1 Tax=Eumeta variegata TaxID=151549 RepID=A0A4C1Y7A1_EUMVA|nr:hypothetical protein EVAR_41582_1 [Eumeta japonica]
MTKGFQKQESTTLSILIVVTVLSAVFNPGPAVAPGRRFDLIFNADTVTGFGPPLGIQKMAKFEARSREERSVLHRASPWLRLGVTYEKGVTLGNVTMSHRTREARRMPCVSLPLNYDRSAALLEN